MNTLHWLIRREFWEHKGGLFWAPVVVAALLLALVTLSVAVPLINGDLSAQHLRIGNYEFADSDSLQEVLADPSTREHLGEALSLSFAAAALPLMMTMSFVVFFYFIGTLFEDRSNRSVLFWKSLPISDRDTVLSKLATGLLLAPLIAWLAALAVAILMNLILGVTLLLLGLNVFGAMLSNPDLYTLPLRYLAVLPVYVLWALPAAGWLIMVSAWARSKPLLWAVGAPLLSAMLLAWATRLFSLPLDAGWYMKNIVGRILVGIAPGSWMVQTRGKFQFLFSDFNGSEQLSSAWQLLATPNLWFGVAAGAAMVVIAMRLRRYRDEG
ncbi:MAG: ABC-2 transporter permease [Betaproteobacteria bacterium]|nr:ABC-2 transporter permease [Betaproteobacteria bacterium]